MLRAVAEGNQQAFAWLVGRYQDRIYVHAVRVLRSAPIAEEVVQDVFLVIWAKRAVLPDLQNFGGYLFTIAKHAIYNSLQEMAKEHARRTVGMAYDDTNAPNNPETALLDKDYANILRQAIDRLPARQKQTYILIRQQGMKREEAAARLGVSPETIKSNLDDALRKMRAYLLYYIEVVLFFLISGR